MKINAECPNINVCLENISRISTSTFRGERSSLVSHLQPYHMRESGMKENTNSDDVLDANPKSFQPQNARYETLIQKLYSLCSELGTIVWNFIYIFQTEILTLFNCCQILANKKLLKNKAIFLILLNWVGMDSDIKSKYDSMLIRVLVDGYLHLRLVKDEIEKYFGNTSPNLKYQ